MITMTRVGADAAGKVTTGLACALSIASIAVALSACGPEPYSWEDDVAGGQYEVWNGSIEPDYKFPWVVSYTGILSCHGTLIDPSWVLTAAHCVDSTFVGKKVRWSRTDPYSGTTYSGDRTVSEVHKHPDFQLSPYRRDDIALIKLSSPFAINKYIQTAGLPTCPRPAGALGALASGRHDGQLLTGQLAVYRAPLPAWDGVNEFGITTGAANNKLDSGDSGSGLVTVEGGRALVRGIARTSDVNFGAATFTDPYAYRGWILSTTGKTDNTLAGNTRVRWSGHTSRGYMVVGCNNPAGTMWGPLNVVGVRLGANCSGSIGVSCALESGQPYEIKSFVMKTLDANGNTVATQSLSHSSRVANYYSFYGLSGTREFTCEVRSIFPTAVLLPGTLKAR